MSLTPHGISRLALLLGCAGLVASCGAVSAPRAESLVFGDTFWKVWGDGQAELAGYDLTFPRYGSLRQGIAVTVFVTETFSNSLRVKSDPGKHPKSDEFPVMKLNLVQDFPTGIYDYNLMTSAFVALSPVNGRPAGAPTKVSYSSQEWCGNVYSQLLFDAHAVRYQLHSYFDGEADRDEGLRGPADGVAEDALLLWARGFAPPALRDGESRPVEMLRSLKISRMRHEPVVWEKATLRREAAPRRVTVPAGTFDVEVMSAAIEGGRTWTFEVERAEPRRIVQWESSEGEKATLLASDRLKYWEMHGEGMQSALEKLGLKARPPRSP